MTLKERFLNYIKFDTTSSDEFEDKASNPNEQLLAEFLKKELINLGVQDVNINKFSTVYGYFPGNNQKESIYLIAHLDTSDQAKGSNIQARSLIYDGKPIELSDGILLDPKEFDSLIGKEGHELIVTDGKTLLGGDDKAGIAIIMTLLEYYVNHPEVDHCPIEIIFNSDEEIGIGASHIDTSLIKSKYGYTVDGGALKYINVETFNAASLDVEINGVSIHPGSAKNKMINASNVAIDFHTSLPREQRPEYTCDREGFYHLGEFSGTEEHAQLSYIVRDHDLNKLNEKLEFAKNVAQKINEIYNKNVIKITTKYQYYNMKEIIDKNPEITDKITKGFKNAGVYYEFEAIRGGTDGSQLSYMGFPTPNLPTGDYNCHGRYEYIDLNEANTVVSILIEMTK